MGRRRAIVARTPACLRAGGIAACSGRPIASSDYFDLRIPGSGGTGAYPGLARLRRRPAWGGGHGPRPGRLPYRDGQGPGHPPTLRLEASPRHEPWILSTFKRASDRPGGFTIAEDDYLRPRGRTATARYTSQKRSFFSHRRPQTDAEATACRTPAAPARPLPPSCCAARAAKARGTATVPASSLTGRATRPSAQG